MSMITTFILYIGICVLLLSVSAVSGIIVGIVTADVETATFASYVTIFTICFIACAELIDNGLI